MSGIWVDIQITLWTELLAEQHFSLAIFNPSSSVLLALRYEQPGMHLMDYLEYLKFKQCITLQAAFTKILPGLFC